MSGGDELTVSIHDNAHGLFTGVNDLTTDESGSMTASAANDFGPHYAGRRRGRGLIGRARCLLWGRERASCAAGFHGRHCGGRADDRAAGRA